MNEKEVDSKDCDYETLATARHEEEEMLSNALLLFCDVNLLSLERFSFLSDDSLHYCIKEGTNYSYIYYSFCGISISRTSSIS